MTYLMRFFYYRQEFNIFMGKVNNFNKARRTVILNYKWLKAIKLMIIINDMYQIPEVLYSK